MKQQRIIIAAISENNVIGRDNRLPWHLPGDWEHFRKVTAGYPFIMGRLSYESDEALYSDYRNIIVSRREKLDLPAGFEHARGIAEALRLVTGEPRVFILGGAEIFREALPLADRLILTIVHHHFEGDTFFPEIDWSRWTLLRSVRHETDERHAYAFSINEYQRTRPD